MVSPPFLSIMDNKENEISEVVSTIVYTVILMYSIFIYLLLPFVNIEYILLITILVSNYVLTQNQEINNEIHKN